MSKQWNTVKIGVIGLGCVGWHIHVLGQRGDERFRISALNDPQDERLQQAQTELGSQTLNGDDEFLNNAECKPVIFAFQSVDLISHAIKALESAWHVVAEKPMAKCA